MSPNKQILSQYEEKKLIFSFFFQQNPNVRILPLFEFWQCLRRTQNAITHRFRRRFPVSISISNRGREEIVSAPSVQIVMTMLLKAC